MVYKGQEMQGGEELESKGSVQSLGRGRSFERRKGRVKDGTVDKGNKGNERRTGAKKGRKVGRWRARKGRERKKLEHRRREKE